MTVEIANFQAAFIVFTAANPPVIVQSNGIDESTLARGGVGIYSVDMDAPGFNDGNSVVRATRSNAATDTGVTASITAGGGSAPSTLDILTFDAAGAAADTDDIIFVEVLRFPTVD